MSISTVFPSLPPNATFAERQEYRRVVLKLPGPIDRWVTANSRHPNAGWVKDFLMLEDAKTEYVDCVVEAVCVMVCLLLHCSRIYFMSAWLHRTLRRPQHRNSIASTRCTLRHVHRPTLLQSCFFVRVLVLYLSALLDHVIHSTLQNGHAWPFLPSNSNNQKQHLLPFFCAWQLGARIKVKYVYW